MNYIKKLQKENEALKAEVKALEVYKGKAQILWKENEALKASITILQDKESEYLDIISDFKAHRKEDEMEVTCPNCERLEKEIQRLKKHLRDRRGGVV